MSKISFVNLKGLKQRIKVMEWQRIDKSYEHFADCTNYDLYNMLVFLIENFGYDKEESDGKYYRYFNIGRYKYYYADNTMYRRKRWWF